MKYLKLILSISAGIAGLALLSTCKTSIPEGATAVQNFDAQKYLGKWYEIARFDYRFEKDINNATANYSQNSDGSIKVVNRGYNFKKNKWDEAEGEARFIGDKSEARLKVSFFKPFWGGYNVIDLVDYQYALVAGDSTKYLWILSREKTIPENIKKRFLEKSKALGFPVQNLIWVDQSKN